MKTSLKKAASAKEFVKFYQKRIQEFETNTINSYFSQYTSEDANACVIKLHLERAVMQYASSFKEYVQENSKPECKNIILDLSDTLFLDSTFLGSIVSYYKQLQREEKSLKLVMDYQKLTIITLIDNYKRVFEIFPSIEEAISSYNISH